MHAALSAIGSKNGFDGDLVAGTGFGYVGAGAFQTRPATLPDQIELKFYTVDRRGTIGIVVNAAETFSERKRRGHGGGLCIFRRREHVLELNFGKAFDVDAAIEAIADFFTVFVHAMQSVKHSRHDRDRAQARVVQDFVVKLFYSGPTIDRQGDRD